MHYPVLVLISPDEFDKYFAKDTDDTYVCDVEELNGLLMEKLDKWNENSYVEPYEVECDCVGFTARDDAIRNAFQAFGQTEDHQRLMFFDREDIKTMNDEERRNAYLDHMREYHEAEIKLFNEHSLKFKPDPDCSECKGTGIKTTDYNPIGKWDWFEAGGRWDEETTTIPPMFHHFTVKISGLIERDGKIGDITKVQYCPYALITPEQEWITRRNDTVSYYDYKNYEKPQAEWQALFLETIKKYSDYYGVLVDIHS